MRRSIMAMVLGQEMAHALREHARARAAKVTLTDVGTLAVGLVIVVECYLGNSRALADGVY